MFCVHRLINLRADPTNESFQSLLQHRVPRWVRQYRCVLKAKEVCLHLYPCPGQPGSLAVGRPELKLYPCHSVSCQCQAQFFVMRRWCPLDSTVQGACTQHRHRMPSYGSL